MRVALLVFDQALLMGPLAEASRAEGQVVVACDEVVGEFLDQGDGQLSFADCVAQERKGGGDADSVFLGDQARHVVVQNDLVTSDSAKGEDAAFSAVLAADHESVLVSGEPGEEGDVVAVVNRDPRCVEDLTEGRHVVHLMLQFPLDALRNDTGRSPARK